MNRVCRKVAALVLAANLVVEHYYVRSGDNPADGPSRHVKLARMRVSDSTVKEYNRGLSGFFDFVGPKWKPKTPEEVDYWLNQFALRIYDA